MRIAMVGCGNISMLAHAPAISALAGDVEVVAVVDPSAARRHQFLAAIGQRAAQYNSVAHFADSSHQHVDVVVVATPATVTFSALGALSRLPALVVTEKPVSVIAAEVREYVSGKGKSRTFVIHNYLGEPSICALRRVAASCSVRRVVFEHYSREPFRGAWDGDPDWRIHAPGGCLTDIAYHGVYLVKSLIGQNAEPTRIEMQSTDAVTVRLGGGAAMAEVVVNWRSRTHGWRLGFESADGARHYTTDNGRVFAEAPRGRLAGIDDHPAGLDQQYRRVYADVLSLAANPAAAATRTVVPAGDSAQISSVLLDAAGAPTPMLAGLGAAP